MINIFETYKVRKQLNENIGKNLIKYSKLGLSATLFRESFGSKFIFWNVSLS